MTAVRVMIVDDHPVWRSALEREPVDAGYGVAGAFAEGETTLRVAPAVRPDVVLMDLQLPGGCPASRPQRRWWTATRRYAS